ncbi:hypothetical protein IJ090_00490, partial [Candidatus Saccharibacteria bacterium]|nr:hypothetical protein [Candidatus Saccharibacteria bacterium]
HGYINPPKTMSRNTYYTCIAILSAFSIPIILSSWLMAIMSVMLTASPKMTTLKILAADIAFIAVPPIIYQILLLILRGKYKKASVKNEVITLTIIALVVFLFALIVNLF